jgi:drug/metabolite transporter (DMT)-like permease
MVLAGGACIGFAPIGLRLGLSDLGPQAIAFWRYMFALPILFVLACGAQKRLPAKPNKLIILAGIFFAGDVALWHWGLEITSVANATFIVNLGNISVGLLAWIFMKERPASIWFVAVLVAVSGAAALSLGGGTDNAGAIKGDLLAAGAAVLVAAYLLCSKIARKELSGLDAIFWVTVAEIGTSSIFVLVSGETFFPDHLSGYAAPFFLALVVQVVGQGLILTGLGNTPAAIAGVMVVVQPVVAAFVAWQLFGETLLPLQLAGAGLILCAIWLAQRGARVKLET